jgi:hypothetical protein
VLDGTSSLSFGNIGVQDYTKIQDGVDSILIRLRPGQAGKYVSIIGGRDFYLVQNIRTGLGFRACCLMVTGVKAAIMWRYNFTLAPPKKSYDIDGTYFFWGGGRRFGSWNVTHVWNNGIAGVLHVLTTVSILLTAPFSDH